MDQHDPVTERDAPAYEPPVAEDLDTEITPAATSAALPNSQT